MSSIILRECPGISEKAHMDLKVNIELIKDICPRADYQKVKKILPSLLRRIVAHDVKHISTCPMIDWIVAEAGIVLPEEYFWHCDCGTEGAPPRTVDVDAWVESNKPVKTVYSVSKFIEKEHCPIVVGYDVYDSTEIEDESTGEEYLAQMEDLPYSSENHIAQTRPGEVLVGGGRRKGRAKGKARKIVIKRGTPQLRFTTQLTPPNIYLKLSILVTTPITNTGATIAIFGAHTNDAVKTNISGTAISANGIDNYLNSHSLHRVHGVHTRNVLTNTQSFAVHMMEYHGTINPVGTMTDAAIQQLGTNSWGRNVSLAPAGTSGAQRVLTRHYSIAKLVGSNAPRVADSYRGSLDGSEPIIDHTFVTYAAYTNISTNTFSTGVDQMLIITYDVELYGRKPLQY